MTGGQRDRRSSLRDLATVAVMVALFFLLAVRVELSEGVATWGSGYEHWELDELPLTLLVLSVGLAWFAFRRAREASMEIRERTAAEMRVGVLLARNRDLAQGLILAQENERRALARELHDEFGQNCTAIRAEASFILNAPQEDRQGMQASARRIADAARNLDHLVRDILQRLRPALLDSLGLVPALQELCESWEEQFGIACLFFPQDVPDWVADSTSIAVFRLAQEGLTNIARHAKADQVRIDLCGQPDARMLTLAIEDNGQGMASLKGRPAGFGVIGMHERVAGLGGTIAFQNRPGHGLRIEIRLPAGEGDA